MAAIWTTGAEGCGLYPMQRLSGCPSVVKRKAFSCTRDLHAGSVKKRLDKQLAAFILAPAKIVQMTHAFCTESCLSGPMNASPCSAHLCLQGQGYFIEPRTPLSLLMTPAFCTNRVVIIRAHECETLFSVSLLAGSGVPDEYT